MPSFGPVAYETHGTLNAAGDNCVLLPSYFGGTDKSYLPMIGPGRALDPARSYIVAVNMLGNGVSASPSNTPGFANATIAANVRAQAEVLTYLGVRRSALIYGWSMGAMQGLAWAAMYPERVAALLAVCGTAHCWPMNRMFLESLIAALPAGKAAFGRVYAPWAYSARFFREELWRGVGFARREDFIKFWEEDSESFDERDLRAMLWTWLHAGLTDEQLRGITARVIAMPCDTDAYFTVAEARIEAALIPGAEVRVLESPYGHCAGAPGRFAAETAVVEAAIRELLGV
jgi:homoserine O-acetyltransferase